MCVDIKTSFLENITELPSYKFEVQKQAEGSYIYDTRALLSLSTVFNKLLLEFYKKIDYLKM